MICHLREFSEESIDGTALLRPVARDDPIALRPLNLDGPEWRRRAMEAELSAACGPQVPHPLCIAAATHKIPNTVQVEWPAERHRMRLAGPAARHGEYKCPPESLYDRIHDVGHDEPGADIPSVLRVHECALLSGPAQ
jgi:hypothetical protein